MSPTISILCICMAPLSRRLPGVGPTSRAVLPSLAPVNRPRRLSSPAGIGYPPGRQLCLAACAASCGSGYDAVFWSQRACASCHSCRRGRYPQSPRPSPGDSCSSAGCRRTSSTRSRDRLVIGWSRLSSMGQPSHDASSTAPVHEPLTSLTSPGTVVGVSLSAHDLRRCLDGDDGGATVPLVAASTMTSPGRLLCISGQRMMSLHFGDEVGGPPHDAANGSSAARSRSAGPMRS